MCDCGAATTDVELFVVPNIIDKTSLKKKKLKREASKL